MAQELPENPNHWPRDPYELLGITREASERDIRRAFFRLAKKYKPDQDPVAFQKIHDAYETAKRYQSYQSDSQETATEGSTPADEEEYQFSSGNILDPIPQPPEPFVADIVDVNESPKVQKPVPRLDPHSDEPWKVVTPQDKNSANKTSPARLYWHYLSQGKNREAVKVLPRIEGQRDRDAAEFALYFVHRKSASRFKPANQAERLRILLKYVNHASFSDNALHYLRNEFQCNTQLAMDNAVTEFVHSSNNLQRAMDVALLRWLAVGQTQPDLVVADTRRLTQDLMEYGENWPSVIAESMEYTVWWPTPVCREHNHRCWALLSESKTDVTDTVEMLIFGAEENQKLGTLGGHEFSRLVPLARTGFDRHMEKEWHPTAVQINSHRKDAFSVLPKLFKSRNIAMSILLSGLIRFANYRSAKDQRYLDYDLIQECVIEYVRSKKLKSNYAANREQILNFCLANQVEPRVFGQVLDQYTSDKTPFLWSSEISNDGALLCVYYSALACQH